MKPALNHMMLHADTLAGEFNTILGYRTSHAGMVQAGGTVPTITSGAIPSMQVGAAYTHTYTATGDATITWDVSAGTLPAGLSLNTGTGVLDGTPTIEGATAFTVRATNGAGTDTVAETPTVAGHNAVRFHQDYMALAGTGITGLSSTTQYFTAFKLNLEALPASAWTILNIGRGSGGGTQSSLKVIVESSGGINVQILDTSTNKPTIEYGFDARLTTGTDYVLHLSIDTTLAGSTVTSVTPVGAVATFLSDIYGTSDDTLIADGDGTKRESTDFTVTQQNPTILTKNSGTWSGDVFATNAGERIKLWVNGVRLKLHQVGGAGDDATDATVTITADAQRRAAFGIQHNAVGATPATYSATTKLGYVDGGAGDVGVSVSFFIFDDAKNEDATTTSSSGADIDLSAFKSAGATPALIYFGGTQVAADWNAGTNQGSQAGTWTMTGTVA